MARISGEETETLAYLFSSTMNPRERERVVDEEKRRERKRG